MPKKVLVALTPAMLQAIDQIALTEHRNRSDLIRESLRRYIDNFRIKQRELGVLVALPELVEMPTPTKVRTYPFEQKQEHHGHGWTRSGRGAEEGLSIHRAVELPDKNEWDAVMEAI